MEATLESPTDGDELIDCAVALLVIGVVLAVGVVVLVCGMAA
jgi:hypothetical protein